MRREAPGIANEGAFIHYKVNNKIRFREREIRKVSSRAAALSERQASSY